MIAVFLTVLAQEDHLTGQWRYGLFGMGGGGAGGSRSVHDDHRYVPVEISGSVLDRDGTPVAGYQVRGQCMPYHGEACKAVAASDAEGRFTLRGFWGGKVAFHGEGWIVGYVPEGDFSRPACEPSTVDTRASAYPSVTVRIPEYAGAFEVYGSTTADAWPLPLHLRLAPGNDLLAAAALAGHTATRAVGLRKASYDLFVQLPEGVWYALEPVEFPRQLGRFVFSPPEVRVRQWFLRSQGRDVPYHGRLRLMQGALLHRLSSEQPVADAVSKVQLDDPYWRAPILAHRISGQAVHLSASRRGVARLIQPEVVFLVWDGQVNSAARLRVFDAQGRRVTDYRCRASAEEWRLEQLEPGRYAALLRLIGEASIEFWRASVSVEAGTESVFEFTPLAMDAVSPTEWDCMVSSESVEVLHPEDYVE